MTRLVVWLAILIVLLACGGGGVPASFGPLQVDIDHLVATPGERVSLVASVPQSEEPIDQVGVQALPEGWSATRGALPSQSVSVEFQTSTASSVGDYWITIEATQDTEGLQKLRRAVVRVEVRAVASSVSVSADRP